MSLGIAGIAVERSLQRVDRVLRPPRAGLNDPEADPCRSKEIIQRHRSLTVFLRKIDQLRPLLVCVEPPVGLAQAGVG